MAPTLFFAVFAACAVVLPQEDSARRTVADLLAKTDAQDGYRLLQVTRLAVQAGLKDESLKAAEKALAAPVEKESVVEALRPLALAEWAGLEGAAVGNRAEKLLRSVGGTSAGPAHELYARLALTSLPELDRLPEVERALGDSSPAVRRLAASLVAPSAARLKPDPLVKCALYDREPGVRMAAAQSLAAGGNEQAFGRVVRALNETSALLRIHSAETLGVWGKPAAVPSLVRRLDLLLQAQAGASAPRSFFFAGQQQAYVSGYKVEVAQASAIAEPEVSILQSGACLDVRVLGTSQESIIRNEIVTVRSALARIAGQDLGSSPAAWAQWYRSTAAASSQPKTAAK